MQAQLGPTRVSLLPNRLSPSTRPLKLIWLSLNAFISKLLSKLGNCINFPFSLKRDAKLLIMLMIHPLHFSYGTWKCHTSRIFKKYLLNNPLITKKLSKSQLSNPGFESSQNDSGNLNSCGKAKQRCSIQFIFWYEGCREIHPQIILSTKVISLWRAYDVFTEHSSIVYGNALVMLYKCVRCFYEVVR